MEKLTVIQLFTAKKRRINCNSAVYCIRWIPAMQYAKGTNISYIRKTGKRENRERKGPNMDERERMQEEKKPSKTTPNRRGRRNINEKLMKIFYIRHYVEYNRKTKRQSV